MATDFQLLSEYFNRPVQKPGPGVNDVAKYILLNAKPVTPAKAKVDSEGPSVMGRIFDILSRPNYAMAEFTREWIETGDPDASALWAGFSGKKKTTFSDALKQGGMQDDRAAAGLGLFLDIFADPTTYIPVAGIASKIKNLRGAAPTAAKVAENMERPLAQQLVNKGEPVNPELFGLPAKGIQEIPAALKTPPPASLPPVLNIPDIAGKLPTPADIKLPPRQLGLDLELGAAKIPDEEKLLKAAKQLPVGKNEEILPKEAKGQASFKFPGLNISKTQKEAKEAQKIIQANLEAPTVKTIAEKSLASKVATEGSNLLSNAQLKDFDKFLKNFGKATAQAQGVSKNGIDATGKIINIALQSGKTSAQVAVEQNAKILDEIVATGKNNPRAAEALTRALEKDLDKIPAWAVDGNKAVESFMGRVATWWGQKDLRPMSLNAIGSSAATATTRGNVLNKLFEPFNQAERHEAFKLAQGLGKANTSETAQLANQISRMMDNLVGQVSGTSVLTKSGVDMDLLNKWMKQYGVGFEFTNKKVKDITGKTVDYSKGTDWASSWKTAQITDDPKAFLFKTQQAMEQATRERALFEEIGERFGSKFPGKGFNTKISGHPYLDGYHFPPEIAKQIPRVVKDWSIPSWKPGSPLLQHYDRILSMWKSGVTIYRPGHHIRNLVGDIYLGWMDGVNTMKPYLLAARVQKSMRGAYQDMADVDKLVELGIMSKNYATPRPNEVIFRNKSGVPFTAEQISAVAHQKGLLEHTTTIEDIIDLGNEGRKSILNAKPFGGRVQAVARGASELISHNGRLAHFIDKVSKSRGNNLEDIFEQASRRARKWHPTGLDLTRYEKTVLRRLIPFYSWIRKSTPLLIEGLVMNPGKAVIPAKIFDAIQKAQGIDTPGRHDPFPVDQMFPEWIKNQGFGPISTPEGLLGQFSAQQPPGYAMAGVGLDPLIDMVTQMQDPMKTIGSSLTPALRIPMELMTGQKVFTGEPIAGPEARPDAMGQYVGENIPLYSAFQGITGITPFGGETKKSANSDGSANMEALFNWLTAAGVKGTGPYIKQAQFEATAPIRAEKKAQKEEFMQYLRNQLGG